MNEPVHSHDPKVKAALDVLESKVEHLVEQHSAGDGFWLSFNAEADPIVATADVHDAEYGRGRLDCMLKNAGEIQGEEEESPLPLNRAAHCQLGSHMSNEEKVLTVHHLTGEAFTVNIVDIEEIAVHPSGEGSQITTALGMVDVRENAADLTVQIQHIDTVQDLSPR